MSGELIIPKFVSARASIEQEEAVSDTEMETESHTTEEAEDGGIGLDDDGKSGKLTLSILLNEKLIEPGDGVMSIDYLGQTFKGDLLAIGKIRSLETGLIFNNPSAWAIYCKKIINPAKKSGCGWASVKYKGRKMDYFKNVWLKRKAQRDAELAKTEAAHALTALSAGLARTEESRENLLRAASLGPGLNTSKSHFVELENWTLDGRMQPFTISVATSAMLVLDLHSHLTAGEVTGYLAGHWDSNSHNLAITTTFPCLLDPAQNGTAAAQRVETDIYEELYGKHLSLVGWYHSNPRGPPAPSIKDCHDQLDFQIKLLGSNDSYTPCIGVICSPYDKESKSSESSIIFYWVYPPGETSNNQEMGKPMRMSYSVIQDPCLSEEVLQQIDRVVTFYKSQSEECQVKLTERYEDNQYYIDKIGRSLISKFPQDQDENLWLYIQSALLQGLDVKNFVPNIGHLGASKEPINGRKISEEEEIDDDEETALNEQEIDDDEETAIVEAKTSLSLGAQPTLTISQFSPMMGTHMTFTRTNTAAGQEVNLSIRETDDMQDIEFPQVREEEEEDHPLELTVNGKQENNKPLNFSNQNPPGPPDDEDSDDDERLVIKE